MVSLKSCSAPQPLRLLPADVCPPLRDFLQVPVGGLGRQLCGNEIRKVDVSSGPDYQFGDVKSGRSIGLRNWVGAVGEAGGSRTKSDMPWDRSLLPGSPWQLDDRTRRLSVSSPGRFGNCPDRSIKCQLATPALSVSVRPVSMPVDAKHAGSYAKSTLKGFPVDDRFQRHRGA